MACRGEALGRKRRNEESLKTHPVVREKEYSKYTHTQATHTQTIYTHLRGKEAHGACFCACLVALRGRRC